MLSILLHFAHLSTLTGHPGEFRMYDFLRREFSWPYMSTNVYHTVRYCQHCPGMGTIFKHESRLQLFSRNVPLEFISVDILDALLRTKSENQYVLIITDRYGKLLYAVWTPNTSSTHDAHVFFSRWVAVYGIPDIIFSDHDKTFVSTFFISLSSYLSGKKQRSLRVIRRQVDK